MEFGIFFRNFLHTAWLLRDTTLRREVSFSMQNQEQNKNQTNTQNKDQQNCQNKKNNQAQDKGNQSQCR
jgi:hypothetical protein